MYHQCKSKVNPAGPLEMVKSRHIQFHVFRTLCRPAIELLQSWITLFVKEANPRGTMMNKMFYFWHCKHGERCKCRSSGRRKKELLGRPPPVQNYFHRVMLSIDLTALRVTICRHFVFYLSGIDRRNGGFMREKTRPDGFRSMQLAGVV